MLTIPNSGRRLKSVVLSVAIHGVLLAAFLYSRPASKPNICMVVPVDESQIDLPMEEPALLEEANASALNPVRKEAVFQPAEPVAVSPPSELGRSAAEVKKMIAPPADNESNVESLRMPGEVLAAVAGVPDGIGHVSSLDMILSASAGSGGKGGRPGGLQEANGTGLRGAGQGGGEKPATAVFGSPSGPKFLRRKIPEYPVAARKQKKEGRVVFAVTIDDRGSLRDVSVMEASDPLFVPPSIAALKKSTFLPASRNGAPVTVTAILPISFVLQD